MEQIDYLMLGENAKQAVLNTVIQDKRLESWKDDKSFNMLSLRDQQHAAEIAIEAGYYRILKTADHYEVVKTINRINR